MTNYVVSYFPSVLLLFAVGSIGTALSIAPFLMSHQLELNQMTAYLKIIIPHLGVVFATFLLPLWLWFIYKKKSWESCGQIIYPAQTEVRSVVESEGSDNVSPSENSPLLSRHQSQRSSIPVILFGLGSILYTIFDIIRDIHEHHFQGVSELNSTIASELEVFSYLFDGTYMVCLVIQVKFFITYNYAILKNCATNHFSIAAMMACQMLLWISSAAKPSYEITLTTADVIPSTECRQPNVTEQTEEESDGFEIIYYGLEPFSVEYLTITSGYLFQLWLNLGSNNVITNRNNNNFSSSINVTTHSTPESDIQREVIPRRGHSTGRNRRIMMGISIIITVVYLVVVVYTSGELVECKNKICSYIYIGITSMVYLPQLLCIYLIFNIHKRYCPIQNPLSANDVLLLFTSGCGYGFFTLQFISLLGASLQETYIDNTFVYIKLLYPLVAMLLLSIETHFLMTVSAIHSSGQELSTFIQTMTFFVGTISVAQWWLISMQRASIEKTMTLFCEFYLSFGPNTTRMILLMLYPFTALYRFHSAIIAFEVILSK